jgi:hypothetical protein
MMDK